MSIFKFIRDKGRELATAAGQPEAGEIEKDMRDSGVLTGMGEDFRVRVEGEKVRLEGRAPSQEVREKAILAAGNTAGIAQVEDAMEAADGGEAAVFHTVESGDTLSKIAQAHFGDAMRYPEIFEANKPMLSDPDRIYPGQLLRIPGGQAKV